MKGAYGWCHRFVRIPATIRVRRGIDYESSSSTSTSRQAIFSAPPLPPRSPLSSSSCLSITFPISMWTTTSNELAFLVEKSDEPRLSERRHEPFCSERRDNQHHFRQNLSQPLQGEPRRTVWETEKLRRLAGASNACLFARPVTLSTTNTEARQVNCNAEITMPPEMPARTGLQISVFQKSPSILPQDSHIIKQSLRRQIRFYSNPVKGSNPCSGITKGSHPWLDRLSCVKRSRNRNKLLHRRKSSRGGWKRLRTRDRSYVSQCSQTSSSVAASELNVNKVKRRDGVPWDGPIVCQPSAGETSTAEEMVPSHLLMVPPTGMGLTFPNLQSAAGLTSLFSTGLEKIPNRRHTFMETSMPNEHITSQIENDEAFSNLVAPVLKTSESAEVGNQSTRFIFSTVSPVKARLAQHLTSIASQCDDECFKRPTPRYGDNLQPLCRPQATWTASGVSFSPEQILRSYDGMRIPEMFSFNCARPVVREVQYSKKWIPSKSMNRDICAATTTMESLAPSMVFSINVVGNNRHSIQVPTKKGENSVSRIRRAVFASSFSSFSSHCYQKDPNFVLKGVDGKVRPEYETKMNSNETDGSDEKQKIPRLGAMKDLKPQDVVNFLDMHIIGQTEAKKAVANALRNRWRRQQILNVDLREDILPKNILMIGPTGVGKTEIARRMAKIIDAPFIKVEATKYTEVGFHGRDVETIIKDLVELAIRHQYAKLESDLFPQAQRCADEKILLALSGQQSIETDPAMYEILKSGRLDGQMVTIDVPHSGNGSSFPDFPSFENSSPSSSGSDYTSPFSPSSNIRSSSSNSSPSPSSPWRSSSYLSSSRGSYLGTSKERTEKKTLSIREARMVLAHVEFTRMINSVAKARLTQQALESVEQGGIVFVDEIDKICSSKQHSYGGPDASAEGVQRDLLPLIEGTTITTRYGLEYKQNVLWVWYLWFLGNVKTDYILFIASGAFHSVKPSDMMAELQGRLPVRVQLKPLTESDFRKILKQTRHNLLEQNIALLATEGVSIIFENSAVDEIARVAFEVNSFVENIGARRLVTIIEKIMEQISFMAPEMKNGSLVRITEDTVREAVGPLLKKTDLHKFIL